MKKPRSPADIRLPGCPSTIRSPNPATLSPDLPFNLQSPYPSLAFAMPSGLLPACMLVPLNPLGRAGAPLRPHLECPSGLFCWVLPPLLFSATPQILFHPPAPLRPVAFVPCTKPKIPPRVFSWILPLWRKNMKVLDISSIIDT